MKRAQLLSLAFILCLSMLCGALRAQSSTDAREQEKAALGVINRFLQESPRFCTLQDITVTIEPSAEPHYEVRLQNHELHISATSGIEACRGFYDMVKHQGAGISTWSKSGLTTMLPSDAEPLISPSHLWQHHPYMNVVTAGYSTPFWDEERWDEEIDWMALHGIDMPVVMMGAEEIYREIFLEMGCTPEEINLWEVGPAHLPWFRMGNIAGNSFDGPLGEEWSSRQAEILAHILPRMRALGMEPVCPAFGGFVPKAFAEHHPATLDTTGWDWVPVECRNYRLNPASEEFVEIGKRFIRKWEQRYGKGKYYLSDSFNEMEVPSNLETLTRYGDSVFRSITASNPDAVWVTQGWTFVYQYSQWGKEKFNALTRNIPSEKIMVLYMSPEYDPSRFHSDGKPNCWERYEGFGNKSWCYTLLPNMGGKTFYTGCFKGYASLYPQELEASPWKGDNLVGYGITAEGIENNEMLYELILDKGWGLETDSVEQWMEHYCQCRYGSCGDYLKEWNSTLLRTLYSRYTDHPRFGWQNGAVLLNQGNIRMEEEFYQGVEKLFADKHLGKQENEMLSFDLGEIATMYIGGVVDSLNADLHSRYARLSSLKEPWSKADQKDFSLCMKEIDKIDELMLLMNECISLCPNQSLWLWEERAKKMASTPEGKLRNAQNARRIVTVWYGNHMGNEPVQDYASRVWEGLVSHYYRPRLVNSWKQKFLALKGVETGFNQFEFENRFVSEAGTLPKPETGRKNQIPMLQKAVKKASQTRKK